MQVLQKLELVLHLCVWLHLDNSHRLLILLPVTQRSFFWSCPLPLIQLSV